MGIFDIFKKKGTDSTFPENELEQSLLEADSNIDAQKYFYQKLLWNQLIVLTPEDGYVEDEGEKNTVKFTTFESGEIPIFTSTNRIFDKGIVKEEMPCFSIKGQDLFGIAKGATFILNPYSDYGKELIPEEIDSIMDGSIYDKIDQIEEERKEIEALNIVFEKACERQEALVFLDDLSETRELNDSDIALIEESISDFKTCLEKDSEHWESMFFMAKGLQRLGRHSEALEQFETALEIEKENHFVSMEASIEALHLYNLEKALFYSEESIKRNPNETATLGNHALNLLLAQRDSEAIETIKRAIKINSKDLVNKNIQTIIKEVTSGKRDRLTIDDVL